MTSRAWSLALLAALGAGFLVGRWSIPRGKPVQLVVGPSRALPERDLSPRGEVRTVIITKTVPGAPAPAPVAVPPDLGQHLQTTTTPLPPLPAGTVFHDAIFGRMEGPRLVLRNLQWMDGPDGRVSLPEARTVTATTTLTLPAPPEPPRWGALALLGHQDGRLVYGAAIQAWKGPVGVQVGTVGNVEFVGAGVRW